MTGPSITYLTERLLHTPEIFFRAPMTTLPDKKSPGYSGKKVGKINVKAVVSDLLFDITGAFLPENEMNGFELIQEKDNVNYLGIVLVACHLFHDEWFLNHPELSGKILLFLKQGLVELAKIVNFKEFVTDEERREELARLSLHHTGLIPEGENTSTALDRLTTLDSIERVKVIEETKKAYKRVLEIQEALAKQEALEAASKMSRD